MLYGSFWRQCPPNSTQYVIKSGDTLSKIATGFGTTVDNIIALNPDLDPEFLVIGQKICVPVKTPPKAVCPIGSSAYEIKSGDILADIARKFNTTVGAILLSNPGINPNGLAVGQVICIKQIKPPEPFCSSQNFYVIRQGDTLASIARSFGIPVQDVVNANPNINPQALFIGQVICLPTFTTNRIIRVSTSDETLSLYNAGNLVKTYRVATGKPTTPTPKGTFTIVNKQVNPGGPFGTRWMGLSEPHYGIHGTNNPASIGTAASNGCIRLNNIDVEELFNLVTVGTTVNIA